MMRFIEALRYSRPLSIAFVGAGGKTTALFQAAREIIDTIKVKNQRTVLVTTTTHLGAWQSRQADHFFVLSSITDIEKLKNKLPDGVVLITGEESNNLLGGIHGSLLEEVRQLATKRDLPLLIEADGAHTCPLKAPAEHEPNVPDFAQHVVVVAGMKGLGKPLTKKWVHRVDTFAMLSGLLPGEKISVDALAAVLQHTMGGLKNIPPLARRSLLLNQADTIELRSQAKRICEQLTPVYDASIIASLGAENKEPLSNLIDDTDLERGVYTVVEPIAGVILAAGRSSRFGEPKQLLSWNGQPLIRHVARAALEGGLMPVLVVVGSHAGEVQSVIEDLPVRIVNNTEWMSGMSTSIKAGIGALSPRIGGVVFLQGDQPQIPSTLIRSLIEAHQTTLQPIVAPQIDGRRGNPVLFDASTFSQLAGLEGDVGGRVLFDHFSVQWITWHDANLLIDIDTPEDYEKFLHIYQ